MTETGEPILIQELEAEIPNLLEVVKKGMAIPVLAIGSNQIFEYSPEKSSFIVRFGSDDKGKADARLVPERVPWETIKVDSSVIPAIKRAVARRSK